MELVGEFMGTEPDRRPGGEQQSQGGAQDRLARAAPHRLRRAVFVAGEHRGHLRPFRRYGRQLETGVHAVFGGPGGWCEKTRGTDGDRGFGVGVNRRCPAELGRDQLGDQRDPGRAPDQQDRIKLRAVDGRRLQRPVQRLDGPVQVWPDHFLELGPGQPDPLPHAAERHRDGGVGVHRQGFLRLGALAAQPGDLGNDVRIVRVDPAQWHPGGGAYVLEQHLVKGDPAEPVDPFGPAKDRERGR